MAIIKCKMCGGDIQLSEDKTFGTCEYCGSTMTLPKVSDEQRAALFNRGNHFRRIGEFDKALAIYENIVREDDGDAEAHWCCALCRFGIEYVEDPNTYEYLPTCHRASFDSFLEDVDYLAALEHSDGITKRQYQKDGAKIAEVQRAILATSQKEEPFDVFICYKETDDETKERTRDSLDAQEIYYNLTQEGYRVFFSRITLEDKAGAEYEPYIFAALNSAKVMVAIGEKAEYFNAVWVKNEWSRFLALMRKDRTKLLLPCYKNMDPYDLPEQLGVLQSYDMAKIGFMQDLIRGIKKVLQKDEPKETVKETVVVQQSAGGANLTAQLKRGQQALEDRDWAAADGFFDKALDMDAECAEAFFGKALAALKVSTGEALVQKRLSIGADLKKKRMLTACERDDKRINEAIATNTVPGYLDAKELRKLMQYDDRAYSSETDAWEARIADEPVFWESDRNLSRALRFAKGEFAAKLHSLREAVDTSLQKKLEASRVMDRKSEEETAKRYHDQVSALITRVEGQRVSAESKREKDYQVLCEQQEKANTEQEYSRAAEDFEKPAIRDYKDSAQRAKQCREEAEKRKAIAAKAAAAKKKKSKTIGLVVTAVIAVAIALALIITQVIIPSGKYKSAEALLAAGDYDDAAAAFAALGKYKNSADMINESYYQKAQAQLAEKYYDGAYSAFTRLGKYKDSADMAKEAWYQKAEAALAEGDFDGARRMFTTLQDYKDSADMANEARYQKAVALLSEEDYDGASSEFATLGDYRDSFDMVSKAIYLKAEAFLAVGDYESAIEAFSKIIDYGDSAKRLNETTEEKNRMNYEYFKELYNNGKYKEAYDGFIELGSYQDSADKAKQLACEYAGLLKNNGRYEDAMNWYFKGEDQECADQTAVEYATTLLEQGDYKQAVKWFETGNNQSRANVIREDYINNHYNNTDSLTYEFLTHLTKTGDESAKKKYNELYEVIVKVIINQTEDDYRTAQTELTLPYRNALIYIHMYYTGGTPDMNTLKVNVEKSKKIYNIKWHWPGDYYHHDNELIRDEWTTVYFQTFSDNHSYEFVLKTDDEKTTLADIPLTIYWK